MSANNKAAQAHSLTDAQVLAALVHRHADGLWLPAYVIGHDGKEAPLLKWLDGLRFDRSAFDTYAASRLDLQASPPLVCEAAMTLRARLAEHHS